MTSYSFPALTRFQTILLILLLLALLFVVVALQMQPDTVDSVLAVAGRPMPNGITWSG